MNKTSVFAAFAGFILLLTLNPRASAVIPCSDCTCSHGCSAACSGGGATNCGATGYCVGGVNCSGGGCLTMEDLSSLRFESKPATQADFFQGRVTARLTWRLAQHVEESGLGEIYATEAGLLLEDRSLAQAPDLAFVRYDRLGTVSVPDLVIDIRSIQEPAVMISRKVQTWLAAGAHTALVVDSATQTVTVHRRQTGVTVLRADDLLEIPSLLPGWAVRVGDLFED